MGHASTDTEFLLDIQDAAMEESERRHQKHIQAIYASLANWAGFPELNTALDRMDGAEAVDLSTPEIHVELQDELF